MKIDIETFLAHYGTPRHSGRYPWGSGDDNLSRHRSFLESADAMRKQGLSQKEIAVGLGFDTTTQLRAAQSIAGSELRQERIATAQKLKDKGYSNVAIGQKMGINESSVRSLLEPGHKDRADVLKSTSDMLRRQVDEKKYVDIGAGVENQLGIASTKLNTAVAMLQADGYEVHPVQVDQLMGRNQKTTVKVLCPPGTTYRDVVANKNNIRQISEFSEDGGRTMLGIQPPLNVSSKRIKINYKEDGGADADGVIYVRPGVEDISLGKSRYAQVRVAVDGTHYMKGMAVYKDDLPPGVDLVFNTNKKNTGNKLDAMKEMKKGIDDNIDEDNPFGAVIHQRIAVGPDGKQRVTSAMNIVGHKEGAGEEGGWDQWSKSLSTQLLSKQSPALAQRQLDETFARKKDELDRIMKLTNPTVKRELLEKFADGADASSVHLKAAALPRQATQVIMPVNSLKSTEVYAPNFRDGERVVLIRYPHGGTFEIPELTVNNKHKPAQELLGKQAKDAIGINAKVASRLSGADFDGDTVVVIPNNNGQIKTTAALKQLKGFDPQELYKLPPDSPKMSSRTKGIEMGKVSNLITDMTIKGAPPEEIARAVRHSMVVIDAEKHHLDYKRSARDHGIAALNAKYQNGPQGGAATIISRATSKTEVDRRKLRSPQDGGPIDPATGRKVYRDKAESYTTRDGHVVVLKDKVDKLAATDDAFTLVSDDPTKMEVVYANHSNRLKELANQARKEQYGVKPLPYSPSAKKAYADQVKSLNAKLDLARKNKPLERQAQIFANATVATKRAANPDLDPPTLKKVKSQALAEARKRTQAEKKLITPTAEEWAAIQAGAISNSQLTQILKNADLDAVRKLATPQDKVLMTTTKSARARDMLASGYTQAEIADALGVSLSTLKTTLSD